MCSTTHCFITFEPRYVDLIFINIRHEKVKVLSENPTKNCLSKQKKKTQFQKHIICIILWTNRYSVGTYSFRDFYLSPMARIANNIDFYKFFFHEKIPNKCIVITLAIFW